MAGIDCKLFGSEPRRKKTVCRCRRFEEPEARDHPSRPTIGSRRNWAIATPQRDGRVQTTAAITCFETWRHFVAELGDCWRQQSTPTHDKIIHNQLMFMHSTGRKISTQIKKTICFYHVLSNFYIFLQVQEANGVPGPSPLHRFGTRSAAEGNSQHCFDVHNEDGDLPDPGLVQGMGFFSLLAEVISSPKNPWNIWNPHFDPFFQTVKSFPKLPKHLGVFPVSQGPEALCGAGATGCPEFHCGELCRGPAGRDVPWPGGWCRCLEVK